MLSSNAVAISQSLLKPLDHVLGMRGQPQLCVPGWGHSTLDVPKHSRCVSPLYIMTQMYQTDSNSRDKCTNGGPQVVGYQWLLLLTMMYSVLNNIPHDSCNVCMEAGLRQPLSQQISYSAIAQYQCRHYQQCSSHHLSAGRAIFGAQRSAAQRLSACRQPPCV